MPPAEKGQKNQAIGISRGRRTTEIHALSDGLGRPIAFSFTGGQAAGWRVAEALLQGLPRIALVTATAPMTPTPVASTVYLAATISYWL